MELWTFGSKPVLGRKLLKEHFLIWFFSDIGRSRKCCKLCEEKYFVVAHTPNMKAYVLKTAFRYSLTVWEAGAWFPATLILHISSGIKVREDCQNGKHTNNLHHLPQQDVVTLSISKTFLIHIHRKISALQCGEWRNRLLPKQKEEDQFPNLWITHSSLIFLQILCTNWSTSIN